jgi:DNA-binding transcriptional ArsR family regulator
MKSGSNYIFFETLSTKLRVDIIDSLRNGPKSVAEICSIVNEDQSKVSHSLKKLKDCHFLNVSQDGKKRIYSLNQDTIVPLLKLVEKHVNKYCSAFCNNREMKGVACKNENLS